MAKTESVSINKEIDEFGNVYYRNEQDQLHRKDGPAVESPDGHKSWWYNNEFMGDSFSGYTQKKFE